MFKAKIFVYLKKTVVDPQGQTVQHALEALDFKNLESVRIGKYIEIIINSNDLKEVKNQVENMCKKLLVNPVVEDYSYQIENV